MQFPGWLRLRMRRPLETALFSAALVGFVTANLGLPLIVPVAGIVTAESGGGSKDKSKPFPCQDRPCGCMSADACMRSCCCFTPKQRLDWARAHNVEPIPELIAAVEQEKECTSHDDCAHCAKNAKKTGPRSCCAASSAKSTAAVASDAATNEQAPVAKASEVSSAGSHANVGHVNEGHVTVSDASERDVAQGEQQPKPSHRKWRVVIIVGSMAAQCHGMGPWSASGYIAVPPAAAVNYVFDWGCAEVIASEVPRLLSASHSPPSRPPRA